MDLTGKRGAASLGFDQSHGFAAAWFVDVRNYDGAAFEHESVSDGAAAAYAAGSGYDCDFASKIHGGSLIGVSDR
jgi:hypothetical protein